MVAIKRPKGFILYEGESAISDQNIVAIATLHSRNGKTGDMVQVWILPADLSPLEALQNNNNKGACGSCKLQGRFDNKLGKMVDRVCYVNVGQAPDTIHKSYKRGLYPVYDPKIHAKYIKGRKTRLGAYGDPAALPCEILEHLARLSAGHTGYSHQLFDIAKTDRPLADRLSKLVMCSCDDNAQHDIATSYGWRAFTVKTPNGEAPTDAIECPYYSHGVQCEDCLLCSGSAVHAKSIYVNAHAKTGQNLPKVQALTISATA